MLLTNCNSVVKCFTVIKIILFEMYMYLFWMSVIPGNCVVPGRNCGALPDVNKGDIEYKDGTEFGDTAVVTCRSG